MEGEKDNENGSLSVYFRIATMVWGDLAHTK